MTDGKETILRDETATAEFADGLAPALRPGDFIALRGDLGAGKSVFARALIRALSGDDHLVVPSPTFTLLQTYETSAGTVWHFDLYRLKMAEEVFELGWDDALATGIVLVEWPERAEELLPARRLDLSLTILADGSRRALLRD